MFAVFKRKSINDNFEFIGFWENKKDDIWVDSTVKGLCSTIENVRIVEFIPSELREFLDYQANGDNCFRLQYDDVNDRVQKILLTDDKQEIQKTFINYDDANAIDFYPQSEIDQWKASQTFWANPDRDWNVQPPTQKELDTYVVFPARQFEIPLVSKKVEILDEIQGIEIDIQAKINQELGVING